MNPFPSFSFFSLCIKRWQYIIPSKRLKSLLCCNRGTKFLQSPREGVQSQASTQPGILVIFELYWYSTTCRYSVDQVGEETPNFVKKKNQERFKNCKGFWYKPNEKDCF